MRDGKRVTFVDYLATRATEVDFTLDAAAIQGGTESRISYIKATYPPAVKFLSRPMLAARDAPARQGKFPVVIYAPSLSATASENSDLCEYLASHGYLVIASASKGSQTREMTVDAEGAEAQASDISYLISFAASISQADLERIAVIGYSWGGLANVVAASRDDRIRALVALDGSVRYYPQLVNGGKDSIRSVYPKRLDVPLIYFSQRNLGIEELSRTNRDTSYSLLNKMAYGDVIIATMHSMNHIHFASDDLRSSREDGFGEYTRDDISDAYSWMAQYALRFLDAYLKNDQNAINFLANKPSANGVPPHTISVELRRGNGASPTRETFARLLAARGFTQASAVYSELRSQGADFKFDANDINNWGGELVQRGMLKEAVAILDFGTKLLPTDSSLLDSLGEVQVTLGLNEDAIKSYRRSVELNPNNANATERLKTLNVIKKSKPAAP
jgi:dienelactone hydrolase